MATQTRTELIDYVPTVFDFSPLRLTDEQFENLCRNHPDLNLEMSAEGELIIVPPTLPDTGWKNSDLITDVNIWARKDKTGIVFDSSSLFTFPNGAKRSPDVSWILREKWDALSEAEKKRFSRLVPDFVIELRSSSDALKTLKKKMAEYIENGVRLGWLIDPLERKVHIYRADGSVEVLDNPEMVAGEDVLIGFELNVREIW
ncbi:MAG: Uma2 family endonuclease [Pyrinomonadaceae bacterium]|nr:Uma2 family endonuclease [Pyrinomonadaceae bacterium]